MSAYITGVGAYLPGEPIGNDEIESYLGKSSGSDRLQRRMLEANGISFSAAGLLTAATLVVLGPYPVAMVGLDTEAVTNSQPPKVTLIALALFQTGLALALEGPVRRWLARDRVWAPVVMINAQIMTIYLWHMTALVLMIGGLMLTGGFGLGVEVDTSMWWLTRPLWLAALAAVTLPFMAGLGRFERPREDRRPAPRAWRPLLAVMLFCIGLGFVAATGVVDDQGLNSLVLSLPFIAAIAGGVGGARLWERNSTR